MNKPSPQDVAAAPAPAGWQLLVLLIAMSAIGPLSVNIIIPAVPALARAFATDASVVQLTISLFFAGLAGAQLLLGTLSDRFGRRPVLLAGLAISVVTSFGAAVATSVAALITARTLQALGASTGIVVGRAIIRDLYERDRAASMIGWVTMSVVAIPMFGPLIGGLLEEWFDWRAIFLFVGAASLVTFLWAVVALPETRPPTLAGAAGSRRLWKEARELLRDPAFAGFVGCAAMISGPFYAVTGGSPHVVITLMGRSAAELGLWLAFASFGYMVGNFLAGRFSIRYGGDAMLWWGLVIELVGAAATVPLVALVPQIGPATIFIPLFAIYVGNGMALPNAIAGAVSVRPEAAGTASGVTGFVQMGFGAVVAQLIAYPVMAAASAMPLAWVMVAQGIAGLLLYRFLVRPARAS